MTGIVPNGINLDETIPPNLSNHIRIKIRDIKKENMEMPNGVSPFKLDFGYEYILELIGFGFVEAIRKPLKKSLNSRRSQIIISKFGISKSESKKRGTGFDKVTPYETTKHFLRPTEARLFPVLGLAKTGAVLESITLP